MDATIAAAWIGAGVGGGVALLGLAGTVATSIVSSNNTRRATERTVEAGSDANRATLIAAREDRLWERRGASYEETLRALLFRQHQRTYELTDELPRVDREGRSVPNPFLALDPPGLHEMLSRLWAYASDDVLAAAEATERAHGQVWRRHLEMVRIEQKQEADPSLATREVLLPASERLGSAMEAATAADGALIKVIRKELRSRPEAAMTPAEVPAVRRGLLHRRKTVKDKRT